MMKNVKSLDTVHTHTHTHTGDLKNNKNKKEERDIYKNASNFGVQLKKEKQNNITMFEDHKSNAVGVGAPDDPQIKYKYINKQLPNNPTSNLKLPTSNTAITLIALIITIIVLLILAGVTLSMVMGENGIINKAKQAQEKTMYSQYKEELQMCVAEIQADEAEQGRTATLEKIREMLPMKAKKLYNITDDEISINANQETTLTEITGVYKEYRFTIDGKYAVTINGPISQIPESYITIEIKKPEGVTEYTNQNEDILVTIHNPLGIKTITKEDGNTIKLNGEKEWAIDYANVEKNTTYTYEIEDINGKKETKSARLGNIDKLAPKEFTAKGELTEEGTLTITAIAEDAEETEEYANSGIEKYEYYVIDENNKEEIYTTNVINNLTGTKYTVYVIAYDRAGNYTQTEKINVKVTRKYKEIEAGQYSTWAIDEKGNLWYAGLVRYGKPENGGNIDSAVNFTKILDGKNLNKISFGLNEDHILALDNENNLYAWGHNTHGQIGNGISQNANYGITEIKKDEVKFKEIASDNGVSRAIDENGDIWTWGYFYPGTGVQAFGPNTPTKIDIEAKFKTIKVCSLGDSEKYTLALDTEGNIWTWGSGRLGLGQNVSVSLYPQKINVENTKFSKISPGEKNSLAIDTDGNIWYWGLWGTNGQTYVPTKINIEGVQFKEISAGTNNYLAIDTDGNIWSTWNNVEAFKKIETESVKGIKFKKVSTGDIHLVALDEDGNIWTCGDGLHGKLGNGYSAGQQSTFEKVE